MRRSDLFSFDHKRVETKVNTQSERLEHPVVSRGANAHGTANTSHSILRNIGPIQESKLGTKRQRPVSREKPARGQDKHSSDESLNSRESSFSLDEEAIANRADSSAHVRVSRRSKR